MKKIVIIIIWLLTLIPISLIITSVVLGFILITNWGGDFDGIFYRANSNSFSSDEIYLLSTRPEDIPNVKISKLPNLTFLYIQSCDCYAGITIDKSNKTIEFKEILTSDGELSLLRSLPVIKIIRLNNGFQKDILTKTNSKYRLKYLYFLKFITDNFIAKNVEIFMSIIYILLFIVTRQKVTGIISKSQS